MQCTRPPLTGTAPGMSTHTLPAAAVRPFPAQNDPVIAALEPTRSGKRWAHWILTAETATAYARSVGVQQMRDLIALDPEDLTVTQSGNLTAYVDVSQGCLYIEVSTTGVVSVHPEETENALDTASREDGLRLRVVSVAADGKATAAISVEVTEDLDHDVDDVATEPFTLTLKGLDGLVKDLLAEQARNDLRQVALEDAEATYGDPDEAPRTAYLRGIGAMR